MTRSFAILPMLAILIAPLVGGCDRGGDEAVTDGESETDRSAPISRTAERGPVTMTVTALKGEITLAERLKLHVEVVADEGIDVEMPEIASRLTEFSIRDFRDWAAEPVAGGKRWRQEYELDVFLSGEYTIPEATAMFTDRRNPDEPVTAGVTTDEFTVNVTSLLEGDFDPTQFRDIKDPVALPREFTFAWKRWFAVSAAGLAVLIAVTFLFVRWLNRERPEYVIPAHEWAFDQLRTLIDEKLVEQGMVHEFYFRLSMIVRVYIERRFDLMAPEWTTEEFLVELQRSLKLPVEYRGMLSNFLKACDLVKYALYEPGAEEIEQAFNAARDFVEQSAERAPKQVAA